MPQQSIMRGSYSVPLHFSYALPVTQSYKQRTVITTEKYAQSEGSHITVSQNDTLCCQQNELEHKGEWR